MIDIVDDGSKEAKEAVALEVATHSKYNFGKDVDKILDWLIGKSCVEGKSEIPDFIIKSSSGVVGIEHFEVAANSVMINDKWQSPLAEASMALYNFRNNKPAPDLDKKYEKLMNAIDNSTYYSSIRVFKGIFEKHLKKVEQYRKQLSIYNANKLIFLAEMLSWNFVGLTAVGKKTFDCNFIKIPLCRDIVKIIATADSVDAVVLLFNNYPSYDSTVFAFAPQQAKDDSIGVEIYEYAGNDELAESCLRKLINTGISPNEFYISENFYKERSAIRNVCNKAFNLIRSGKSCIVDTGFYDTLVQGGVIHDARAL
jgi:hypothetical protein